MGKAKNGLNLANDLQIREILANPTETMLADVSIIGLPKLHTYLLHILRELSTNTTFLQGQGLLDVHR